MPQSPNERRRQARSRGEFQVGNTVKQDYASLKAEVERLRNELEARDLRPFVQAFQSDLGTLLACTPYDRWPRIAKIAFEYTSKSMPVSAAMYRERLDRANKR